MPTSWQGLVLRNGLEKMPGVGSHSEPGTLPGAVKVKDLRTGQGTRYRR